MPYTYEQLVPILVWTINNREISDVPIAKLLTGYSIPALQPAMEEQMIAGVRGE